jgi:thiamine biosynthesis protein ThiI
LSAAAEPVVIVASAEFTLKSSPVRRTLEQRLIDDLKFALRRRNLECSRVEKEAARLVVFGAKNNRAAAVLCSRVFGVAYAAPAMLLPHPKLEDITQNVVDLAKLHLSRGESFAIRAHRSTPGEISRREVELGAGSGVLESMAGQGVKVDLEKPHMTFYVDLVGNDAYVYSERLQGPGGLPLSAQWKMLAVLDSGPLSVIAACAMMRRGSVVQLLVPISAKIPSMSHETQMDLATRLGDLVARPNYKAFVVEVDDFLRPPASLDFRSMIRSMAVKFARENRFKGVVFGDIAGHLSNLKGTNRDVMQPPIFYPLLGLDVSDLTGLSNLLGLGELVLASGEGSVTMPQSGDSTKLDEDLPVPVAREVEL